MYVLLLRFLIIQCGFSCRGRTYYPRSNKREKSNCRRVENEKQKEVCLPTNIFDFVFSASEFLPEACNSVVLTGCINTILISTYFTFVSDGHLRRGS